MVRLKTAKAYVDAVLIECAHCGELCPSPDNGSLMWTREEYDRLRRNNEPAQCEYCNESSKLPANAFGRNNR